MTVEGSVMQFIVRTFPDKHVWISKFVLDCFEGQIISSVVVVVFVAMFLLQEWVIQNADLDADRRVEGLMEELELAQAMPANFPDEDPVEEAADQQVEQDAGRARFNMEQAMERLIAAQHQIQAMMDGETDVEEDEPVLPEQAPQHEVAASLGSATAGPSTLQRQLSSGVAFENTPNSPDEFQRRPNQGNAYGGLDSFSSATTPSTRNTLYYDASANRSRQSEPFIAQPLGNATGNDNGEGSSSRQQQSTEEPSIIRSKSGRLFYWDEDETIPLTIQNVFVNRDGTDMTIGQKLAKYDELLKTGDLAFAEVRRLPMKWRTSQLFAQENFSASEGSSGTLGSSGVGAAQGGGDDEDQVRIAPFREASRRHFREPLDPQPIARERVRDREQERERAVAAAAAAPRGDARGFAAVRPINPVAPAPARVQVPAPAPAPVQPQVAQPAEPRVGGMRAQFGEDALRDQDDDFDEIGAEELHGILEVIGMHGSYWILLQNSLLMSALICATLGVGVWIPYMIGKTTLLMNMFNIVRFPIHVLSRLTDPITDFIIDHIGPLVVQGSKSVVDITSRHIQPIFQQYMDAYLGLESLQPLKDTIRLYTLPLWQSLMDVMSIGAGPAQNATATATASVVSESMATGVTAGTTLATETINSTTTAAATLSSAVAGIAISPMVVVEHVMKRWTEIAYGNSSNDKAIAIMIGYVLLFIAAYWYMDQTRHVYGQTLSRVLRDIIRQQGMILKIAFFVAIEMVVFPLFCGALISLSTLPVFKGATLASRFAFYMQAPNWSIIMHWIVGTAFMFNFSMFVGACRGMVRPGVMWFIRDPNDPGFHPIREILERPIMMQLRKLGTGALMYMVLIVGGIAVTCYSIPWILPGVFPLRLPVDRPLSDIPLDLLLFWLGPSLVRTLAISDHVKRLFEAWWRKMSRLLRLSSFMYGKRGERFPEQEGHVEYRTWRAWLLQVQPAIPDIDQSVEEVTDPNAEAIFVRDGGLYRVPNTDRILHLKDRRVLVPVDEEGNALDPNEDLPGEVDPTTDGQFHIRGIQRPPQDPKQDTVIVYGPPDFKRRLLLFVVLLWASVMVFCAASVLLPIMTGRLFTAWYLGDETLHDSITFFWGACILGSLWFLLDWLAKLFDFLTTPERGVPRDLAHVVRAKAKAIGRAIWHFSKVAARLAYFAVTLGVLVPLVTTLVLELYVFLPLRRFFTDEPGINFFLDWAFGFTFIRTVLHTMFLMQEMGMAVPPETGFMADVNRLLVAPRILDWNLNAVTRQLIVPFATVTTTCLVAPTALAKVLTMVISMEEATQARLFRQIHPISMFVFMVIFGAQQSYQIISRWSQYVRDEEYLLGRQLHNLEEEEEEEQQQPVQESALDDQTNASASTVDAGARAQTGTTAGELTSRAAREAATFWAQERAKHEAPMEEKAMERDTEEEEEDPRMRVRRAWESHVLNQVNPATAPTQPLPRPPAESSMSGRRTGEAGDFDMRGRESSRVQMFRSMFDDPELSDGNDDDKDQRKTSITKSETNEQQLQQDARAAFWRRLGQISTGSISKTEKEESEEVKMEQAHADHEEAQTSTTEPSYRDKGKGKKADGPVKFGESASSNMFWATGTREMEVTWKQERSEMMVTREAEILRSAVDEDEIEGDSIAARTRSRRAQRLQALDNGRRSSSSGSSMNMSMGY
ncbi:hypothetical protein BGW41_002054 [Actinomortierella wolfii]|nr:hypothetical protein BGW41_002054 [Actinomortierella wolfii]